jgi:hypothetical protein
VAAAVVVEKKQLNLVAVEKSQAGAAEKRAVATVVVKMKNQAVETVNQTLELF